MNNKKQFLLVASSFLAIITFFMVFITPLCMVAGDHKERLEFADVYFGTELTKGAVGGFIGFSLVLIAGLLISASVIASLLKKELPFNLSRVFNTLAIILLIVGVVLMLCTKHFFISANPEFKDIKNYIKLCAGPIIGGIFGIISLGCVITGEFVVKK